jgi:hypothetical protein
MGNGKVPPVRPFPLMAGLPAYWYQVGKGGHGARTTRRCGRWGWALELGAGRWGVCCVFQYSIPSRTS